MSSARDGVRRAERSRVARRRDAPRLPRNYWDFAAIRVGDHQGQAGDAGHAAGGYRAAGRRSAADDARGRTSLTCISRHARDGRARARAGRDAAGPGVAMPALSHGLADTHCDRRCRPASRPRTFAAASRRAACSPPAGLGPYQATALSHRPHGRHPHERTWSARSTALADVLAAQLGDRVAMKLRRGSSSACVAGAARRRNRDGTVRSARCAPVLDRHRAGRHGVHPLDHNGRRTARDRAACSSASHRSATRGGSAASAARHSLYFVGTTLAAAIGGSSRARGARLPFGPCRRWRPAPSRQRRGTPTPSLDCATCSPSFPPNPFAAAAQGELLPLIVAVCIFAAAATTLPERQAPARRRAFSRGVNDLSMVVIGWLMQLAPHAVVVLIAGDGRQVRARHARNLAIFAVVVVAALLIHVAVVLAARRCGLARGSDVAAFCAQDRRRADARLLDGVVERGAPGQHGGGARSARRPERRRELRAAGRRDDQQERRGGLQGGDGGLPRARSTALRSGPAHSFTIVARRRPSRRLPARACRAVRS